MTYQFVTSLSEDIYQNPILISGEESKDLHRVEYLVVESNEVKKSYEIRYEYHCSSFREAKLINNVLAVGLEEYFYLFDLDKKQNILSHKLCGYFGHLYFYEDLFYVADAYGITCVNIIGEILWQNSEIAIDGVVVEKFEENKIYGIGEHDPPGGWQDFVLDLASGLLKNSI